MTWIDATLISAVICLGLMYGMLTVLRRGGRSIVNKDVIMLGVISIYGIAAAFALIYRWPSVCLTVPLVLVMLVLITLKRQRRIGSWMERRADWLP